MDHPAHERDPGRGADLAEATTEPQGRWTTAWLVVVAVAASLPILWVVGAVPWRLPTLIVEKMFRSFATCAMDGGALTPVRMLCPEAGVPVGMHQLDGGLTYPLGGLLIRAGADPLTAWKVSVAAVVIVGTAALCWLLLRLTASPLIATIAVVVHGLGGTASARSWDWYWRVTGSALLPVVFAAVYVLYVRAPQRRLRPLLVPGLALFASVLAVSIEWQYAGLFATGTAAAAMLLLTLQRGWRWQQRIALTASTAAGLGVLFALLRWRLSVAGIGSQMDNALAKATGGSVDLVSFVVPDGPMSLVGRVLTVLGWDDRLVRSMVEHKQLWVAPYVGGLVAVFLLGLLARHRFRLPPAPGRPRAFLPLLSLVAVASVVFALGPQIRLAGVARPAATFDSPIGLLYAGTPLEWIRFPRTWVYLLHLALLLIYASLAASLLRRGRRRWSPLLLVLAIAMALDFVSPQVLGAFDDPRPSIALAPGWTRIDSDDPAAVRFARREQPAFEQALRGFDGPVVMFPWGNTWSIASLGPSAGIPVRNVGIDRNVAQVVDASPFSADQFKRATPELMRRMLDSEWAAAVVMLDLTPHGTTIDRFDSQRLRPKDLARRSRRVRRQDALVRAGYCVTEGSWFAVIAVCHGHTFADSAASRRPALPGRLVPRFDPVGRRS